MRKYLAFVRNNVMSGLVWRSHYFFLILENLLSIVLLYFLWKAIYAGSGNTLNGMTFQATFVYMSVATLLYYLFRTWVEWDIADGIRDGSVIMTLIKPLDFYAATLARNAGSAVNNFIALVIPSVAVLAFFFHAQVPAGWNIPAFLLSVVLAYLINFNIDYFIGIVSFYTESIWGISMTKEVVVLLLSGATIPLAFFPDRIRQVLEFLPFHAIFNVPIRILLYPAGGMETLLLLARQAFWIVVLFGGVRLFYRRAVRVIFINGG